jgi:hypothetical protein
MYLGVKVWRRIPPEKPLSRENSERVISVLIRFVAGVSIRVSDTAKIHISGTASRRNRVSEQRAGTHTNFDREVCERAATFADFSAFQGLERPP